MHFVAEFCLISVLLSIKETSYINVCIISVAINFSLLVSTFNYMVLKQSNSVKKIKVYETNQVVYTLSDREVVESI